MKAEQQSEGLANMVREDASLDQGSDDRGGEKRSDASPSPLAIDLPRACAGRHIFIFMTIA